MSVGARYGEYRGCVVLGCKRTTRRLKHQPRECDHSPLPYIFYWTQYPSGQSNGLLAGIPKSSSLVPLKSRHAELPIARQIFRDSNVLPECSVEFRISGVILDVDLDYSLPSLSSIRLP
ncbi:hypothetical protein TNCV_1894431 [Trichonephila clavipes]|nr:hypothetical protein TNCV_1894431 [Trichonephila clavipes]